MLRTLMDLMDSLRPSPAGGSPASTEHTLQLATAVMLVEVMRADQHLGDAERAAVRRALEEKFRLGADESARLSELAVGKAREASDLFAFTSCINERFDMTQKIRMIEHMWHVALADGHLDAHERHVLWRVADLLHVPQGAYVHARMRAEQASGRTPGG
jgi:uncharacterized tellurite resistance protein B-like protein